MNLRQHLIASLTVFVVGIGSMARGVRMDSYAIEGLGITAAVVGLVSTMVAL